MCDFELRFLVLSCPLKRNVALVSLSRAFFRDKGKWNAKLHMHKETRRVNETLHSPIKASLHNGENRFKLARFQEQKVYFGF
jgi:hypothetical protein